LTCFRFAFKKYGENPLTDAAQWGKLDVVELLLNRGAKIEATNKVMNNESSSDFI